MKRLTYSEIVKYNELAIEKIIVKKADKHEILSNAKITKVVNKCKRGNEPYGVAACILKGLIQEHPFASGNRRTAFMATQEFLDRNNVELNVDNSGKQARVLQGIRENFYKDKEIKDWLKTGKIREFER